LINNRVRALVQFIRRRINDYLQATDATAQQQQQQQQHQLLVQNNHQPQHNHNIFYGQQQSQNNYDGNHQYDRAQNCYHQWRSQDFLSHGPFPS
jgi:DNA mismatch repair ATPase MutL